MISLLVLVTGDIHVRVMQRPNQGPCLAIPTKPVLQEPEHAKELLGAANVSNVRIVSTAPVWPGNVSPTDERDGMMKCVN